MRESHLPRWLFLCAAMVAGMVALGGLTRLTGSGLSMVEWNPHHLTPPLSLADWQTEFAKYRATPQFQLVNSAMDLEGFKSIYWLEYLHRLWGRLTGAVFLIPLAIFWAQRRLPPLVARRLVFLGLLGAAQGGLGWFMVSSGLAERPEVSPVRLSAHLLTAILIFGGLLWTAMDLRNRPSRLRPSAALLALLLAVMGWGALVAGLHAGAIHNTFPLMGDGLFPAEGLMLSPPWLNAVENPAAAQYVHRVLAVTLVLCLTLLAAHRRSAPMALVAAWAWAQAGLGVATLLLKVPLIMAALHQSAALALFALLTWALHRACAGLPPRPRPGRCPGAPFSFIWRLLAHKRIE